jgi:hypothetical protein
MGQASSTKSSLLKDNTMAVLIKDTTYANETTPIWSSSSLYRQPVGVIDGFANGFIAKVCPTGTVTSMFNQALTGVSLLPNTAYNLIIPIEYASTVAGTYEIITNWIGGAGFTETSVFMNTTSPLDASTLSIVLVTPPNPVATLQFAIRHDNAGSPTVSLGINVGTPGIAVKQW